MNSKPQRVIWAIDPYVEERKILQKVATTIKVLGGNISLMVEPVYVLTPEFTSLTGLIEDLRKRREVVLAELKKISNRYKIPGILPPKVLIQDQQSVRNAVRTLVQYADESNADLIVSSTHGRKGLKRYFFGSFAETLYLQTEVPVLIVNPSVSPRSVFRSVLFPTDFSTRSKEALKKVSQLCINNRSKVILFHKVSYSPAPILPITLVEVVRRKKAIGKRWQRELEGKGIQTRLVVDESLQDTGTGILSAIKKINPDLIAMASLSGQVASVIAGSFTRRVVREAKQPVWVVHPKQKKTKKRTLSKCVDLSEKELNKAFSDGMDQIEDKVPHMA